MLGLRGSPLNRHQSNSSNPAKATYNTATNLKPNENMANGPDVVNGHHHEANDDKSYMNVEDQSLNQPLEVRKGSSMTNGDASYHDSYSKTRTIRKSEMHTTTMNGSNETHVSFSKDQQVTVLRETVTFTWTKFVTDIDQVDDHYIKLMTIDGFLEYIERQRLTHMPHRGNRWDKVLKWAEYFGLQVSEYAKAVESFVPDSQTAAKLIWAGSCSLLELGPENAKALETTFGVFYELGLSLSLLLHQNKLLHANSHIRLEVAQAYNGMLILVRDVSTCYHAKVADMSNDTRIDFTSLFRAQIQGFVSHKNCIIDSMWKEELDEHESMDVATLRSWLNPRDRMLKKLHEDRTLTPEHRDEYTCEWFQRHLLDFSRSDNDILTLAGPEGCGKTYLSRWIIERLQRPLSKKIHETLFYKVEADIPRTTQALTLLMSLSLQLLEKNIGDRSLFDALVKAHDLSMTKNVTASNLEDAFWDAVDVSLDRFTNAGKDHLMIVVDGLDKIKNRDNVHSVIEHLGYLTSRHSQVQAITISHSAPHKPKKGKIQAFQIKPDHTLQDLRHIAEHKLSAYVHYRDQSEHQREAIVEQLIHAAQGNFLWLLLTIHLLKKESSHDAFEKAVKAVKDSPKTVDQILKRFLETIVDFSRSDAYLVLSWMLVAERPLALSEIKNLLQVDIYKGQFIERKTDTRHDIHTALGPLAVFQNDFVRLRHPIIRDFFLDVQSHGKSKLLNQREAQKDLSMRLLAYCKFTLPHSYEPSLDVVGKGFVGDLFSQHILLEYAVCHWTHHFRSSSMHSGDSFQLSTEFKNIFPGSALMAMLEWACWSPQVISQDSYELALRVRQSTFTEKHECVLQSLIVCGAYFRTLAKTTEAGTYFYRASRVGQAVLRKNHALIVTCATTFLSITQTVTTTVRSELTTWKEETLRYVIDVYKHQHGQTHDLVIRYYKMLAQLYVEIREEHKAESIWRELREIVVSRFGKGSEEETSISEQLVIVLKKGERKTNVEYEKGIFDITTELEVWDIRRVELSLELARSYEARRELFMAEELYITLWRRLNERCHHAHHHHGVEIHILTIDVALEYVRFLRRCHRHEEACNILICVWTEYEEYTFESETLYLRLKVVGELMRAVSLLSIAVSVFKKCWTWFESRSRTEHTASCEVLISETIKEITTTSTTTMSSSTTTSTTTLSSSETIIKETFESTLTRKEVTSETISVCKSLISYHMKLEQWSQAIEVTRRSLSLIWKFVVSGAGTIALPQNFGAGAIDIAISLAICHHRSYHYHEAEEIYVRIYRACLNSCHIEDDQLIKSYEVLIKFYEDHCHWHKMVEIYQDLLIQYRRSLGAAHKLTIRTLYILGSLCAEHGHGVAKDYYVEIIEVLNHGSGVCHVDALDAMFVMCRIYYEEAHWHKLKNVCKILWETWRDQHHGHNKFTTEFIEILYLRYRYVLEYQEICEYSVLRKLTIEYRKICIRVFGATALITIRASIELAEICIRSETYVHEAISIYEEVLTTIKTTTTTTTTTKTSVISTSVITKIKKSLIKAYVSVCSHESTSISTIERAITVMHERYESLKVTFGFTHSETLTCLRELVILQMKLKKQDLHVTIVRMLATSCIEIIKTTTESRVLHEAAKSLAEIYVSCGLSEEGIKLIEELRIQIITGAATDKSSFKLDKSVGKVSYVFLVTFEQTVRGHITSYAEIMAELLTETYLYESYHRYINSQSETTIVLVHAARLRGFLASHGRRVQKELVQGRSFEIFIKKWESVVKRKDEISFMFFLGLLGELEKDARDVSIGNAACAASITIVKELLNGANYQKAFDVASCALNLINHQRAFHLLQNVPYGFKLSALMVGRGLEKPFAADINPKLRESMLELSRKIIREVLGACKDSNVNFIRMKLTELNSLSGLLGEQQNYADLEWLLDLLWSSREVQKQWKPENIVAIGRRFVQARYLNKDRRSRAIRLCEDICYNLRRVWGSLDPKALEMSELLYELYTSMGHFREAQGVEENIIRLVVEGDDGDDRTLDTMPSHTARKHLDLLKQSYLRLQGWDKSSATYKDLVHSLITMYKGKPEWKNVSGVETWNLQKEKPSDTLGKFAAPKDWEFASPEDLDERSQTKGLRRPGLASKRATSNWGIGEVYRALQGRPEKVPSMNGSVNGAEKQQVTAKTVALDDEEDGYESATEEPKSNGIKA